MSSVVLEGTVEAAGTPAPISYPNPVIALKIRDAFTSPVLTNTENLPVTYASSNTSLATVDANTGVVTLKEGVLGETVISATFAGNDTYVKTVAECKITVASNVTYVYAGNPALKVPSTFPCDVIIDASYTTEGTQVLTKKGVFLDDDYVVMETVNDGAKLNGYAQTYLGQTFTKSLQMLVDAAPSASAPTGKAHKETTAIQVTPKADLTLVIFGMRKVEIDPKLTVTEDDLPNNNLTMTQYFSFAANDKYSVMVMEQGAYSAPLDQKVSLGAWALAADQTVKDPRNNAYVGTTVELKKDKVYTVYATQTYNMNGIGYIRPAGGSVAVETIEVDENAPVEYYNLQGIRVENPENGIYIRRQGNKVTKVLVK
ncbi:MAG: hypothetical protein NC039_03850 [Muribaculaceae bacterium]|nr:hypothetical protein [Muribaculaceae bacterium]